MQNMIDAIEQEIQFANVSQARPRPYRAGYTRALEVLSAFLNMQGGSRSSCDCVICAGAQRMLSSVSPEDHARSQPPEGTAAERNRYNPDPQLTRPRGVVARARQKHHRAKSDRQPIQSCTRKEREIAASLTRRAGNGEFLAFRNLFVLVPNGPAKVDAEPNTPDRH